MQSCTTSNFDSEYLQNGWRYSKSEKYIFYRSFSHVRRKKVGWTLPNWVFRE